MKLFKRVFLMIYLILSFQPNGYGQELFEEISLSNLEFTSNQSAHGVSVADYDNDGDDDFLILNDKETENIKLFRNDGNFSFTEVSLSSGLNVRLKSRLAVWFDADNDGWLDIYIGSTNTNQFFRNNGNGTFTETSESSGLKTVSFAMSFMVGDLNNDQLLDIYVANLFEENQLFLNHGDGKFYNHIKGSGAEIGRLNSMGGVLFDYDQDGDLDIYCVYDQFEPNKLFINDGNAKFINMAPSLNADFAGYGMGVDFADFNHDSKYDLYLSYYYNNALLVQQENGQFEETSNASGAQDPSMSWGIFCADMNNDSHSDLFFTNSLNTTGSNRLFYNNGSGTFTDVSKNTNLSVPTNSFGCAYTDLNNDGFLDLIVANSGKGAIQVFKNNQSEGNWMKLNLVGTSSNKFGVGARVELIADGVTLLDEVTVGSGYSSQNSYTLHFGIGSADRIESLNIYWPDGSTDNYSNLNSNTRLLAIQNESLNVFNASSYEEALSRQNTIPNPNITPPESLISGSGYSVARIWNEALLDAIRSDLARPTIHARNLFHASVAMYDSWAVYEPKASTYFLGQSINKFYCPFDGVDIPTNPITAQEETMSYAVFRLLNHRFAHSPNAASTLDAFSKLFQVLGYDKSITSTDYTNNSPAALGNYLAEQLIAFGLQDGSNEQNEYAYQVYEPKNEAFFPLNSGDSSISDPNHWQPLAFKSFIDQSGNDIGEGVPKFLSPEWGKVVPFAMTEQELTIRKKGSDEYWLYHDPGSPPLIDTTNASISAEYKWNFSLVAIWSSHLDPEDDYLIDISPKSQGNISDFPSSITGLRDFYKDKQGGDIGKGYSKNPFTGLPYEQQLVKRSDYARVLAEFWADGPDSETPPGHWFTLLNYVTDHPQFEKRFTGSGSKLSDLEWDVKAYFVMGGAMHDAAISAWSVKGYYDYIRPVSAIRYMVQKGQCTSASSPNYHPAGIPLQDGFIELIKAGDPLAGDNGEQVNEIKIKAWKGPHFIENPAIDVAGVDWILGADWSPYQRASFVTPPFAGYVSGHSTFSRAAAEVMTLLTGDEYFPGGMSEFKANKNDFLVFEEGPTEDIVLQWAKYKDASDQCSLSRIWGGIHPPADDIPGRLMGMQIGQDAFEFARPYFEGTITATQTIKTETWSFYPNPVTRNRIHITNPNKITSSQISVFDLAGKEIVSFDMIDRSKNKTIELNLPNIQAGIYLIKSGNTTQKMVIQ